MAIEPRQPDTSTGCIAMTILGRNEPLCARITLLDASASQPRRIPRRGDCPRRRCAAGISAVERVPARGRARWRAWQAGGKGRDNPDAAATAHQGTLAEPSPIEVKVIAAPNGGPSTRKPAAGRQGTWPRRHWQHYGRRRAPGVDAGHACPAPPPPERWTAGQRGGANAARPCVRRIDMATRWRPSIA